MYLSAKYVILYAGSGLATGWISKGAKTPLLVGMGISALVGASFGIGYAVVSAIEFGVGFGVAAMLLDKKKKDSE